MPPNPYVNYTGVPSFPLKAATTKRLLPNGTATLTTAYQLLMPENAQRRGFDIESGVANGTAVLVRFGLTGPEWELAGGGGISRNKLTGDVYPGDIYIKGASGAETFIAEEH